MKKIISILLVCFLFISSMNTVFARILTIDDVAEQLNNEYMPAFALLIAIDSLLSNSSSEAETPKASVDETNKTLDFYVGTNKIATIKYTDDYIEYENRTAVVNKETADEYFLTNAFVVATMQSMFDLSGNERKTINFEEDYSETYDTYGIILDSEHYEFTTEEDGTTSSSKGEFVKYLKMSFDTDKITELINKYGEDLPDNSTTPGGFEIPEDNTTPNNETTKSTTPNTSSAPEPTKIQSLTDNKQNPYTGAQIPIAMLTLLTGIGSIVLLKTRKKRFN